MAEIVHDGPAHAGHSALPPAIWCQVCLDRLQLGFDVPGIRAKSERLIVVIVDTGGDAGLFYASIPENAPELVRPARDALAALRVDR
jgi:hypothetical protein